MTDLTSEQVMREEAARLERLGEGLAKASKRREREPDQAVLSPEDLAALQDRNLAAFERMNAAAGTASLTLMRGFADAAQTSLADGADAVFEDLAESMRAASDQREALTRAFLDELEKPNKEDAP